MVDSATLRTWLYRMVYLVTCCVIIFFHLIPLQTMFGRWPAPDLISSLTFAWILRRPEYVPVLMIAAVMFLADMLLLRPPGLQAAFIVIGAEFLRRRWHLMRELPFWMEWAVVAGVLVAIVIGQRLLLTIAMLERPSMSLTLLQLLATILSYPLVVFATRNIFGVQKSAPGAVDALGHRI